MLLSSAGRRVELLNCFRQSAAELDVELTILASDMQPAMSAACHEADGAFVLPPCLAPDYAERLLEICLREGVSLVVPTIDTELVALAQAAPCFAAQGVRICISAPEAVGVCRDKLRTAGLLRAHGFDVPRSAPCMPVSGWGAWEGPVIVKPIDGSSSMGIGIFPDAISAEPFALRHQSGHLVQEFIKGEEYTVNCHFDPGGRLRSAVPHLRIAVRQGEVSKGRTARIGVLLEAARRLECLPIRFAGPVCFQVIVREGRAYLFEINARFGGGYPLSHRAGAPFTRWLLEESLGREPDYREDWKEGLLMLRHDSSVFIGPEGERLA